VVNGASLDNSAARRSFCEIGVTTTNQASNSTDGLAPQARPLQAIDGNFYGPTNGGEVFDPGTVFKMSNVIIPK
jgi:hypothetical protein